MSQRIILASGSHIRQQLLRNAGLDFDVVKPRVDEESAKAALLEEGALPRDVADALAELKASRVSSQSDNALVIGCDQVLALKDRIFSKPESRDHARTQLQELRNDRHSLLSAVVVYEGGKPIWRHVGEARLRMRDFSDAYLDDYLDRNWESVRHAVGAYKLEEEGVRLFSRIEGDYFHVLGLPLIELLSYLTLRGTLPS
jgi:septum formation protein